ncbi:DUF4190 domain-containing protein [Nocardia paucivorans]|uniref:DUF4190 domain-containing protein n=1 Tax=Nocardia paucivorans TaxID=114259 RepID=UPI000302EC80|nr:DUF4190 domain-containing protein [Nocardia paucivorans]
MSEYPPVGGYPPPPPPGSFDSSGGHTEQEPRRSRGMAVTALVLGIVALLGFWTVIGGILFGIAAVVLGLIAFLRARRGRASGGAMAMVGLVLGLLSLIGVIVALVLTLNVYNNTGGREFLECIDNAGDDRAAAQKCQDDWYQRIEDHYRISLN